MRRIRDKIARGGSKVVGSALSVVLAVGLMPAPAFAGEVQVASGGNLTALEATTESGMSDENLLICASFAANIFTPEMLGLSNPNYRDNGGNGETVRDTSEPGSLAEIFGDSKVNESVDPYIYNYAQSTESKHLTPYVCWGGRNATNFQDKTGNPGSALVPYDDTEGSEALQNAVWQRLPQIILGTGALTHTPGAAEQKTMYQSTDYWDTDGKKLGALATSLGKSADELANYKPVGAVYNNKTLSTLCNSVYYLAQYAEEILSADSTLKTRYSASPMEIAKDYERFQKGMKGYVLKAINAGVVKEKTVALVSNYDSSANAYTIDPSVQAAATSTSNRFLEGVLGVAKEYSDTSGTTTAKASELESGVDLIIVNGTPADGLIGALEKDGLLSKTYYVKDANQGSTFMLTANSCEAAQLVGRILPCLYPELLDQSDMVAYWYDTFYHINSGSLKSVIDKKMDNTRNWAATDSGSYLQWSESDVNGYNHDAVEAILTTGAAYLLNSYDGDNVYLTLAEDADGNKRLAGDTSTVKFQTITTTASASSSVACGSTLALGAKTNGNGKLSYASSDTSVATVSSAGVVTPKKVGTATITVTASGTTTYGKAVKDITVKVTQGVSKIQLAADSKAYTGKTLAYGGKVTKSGSSGAVTYAYYSDAACTKKATPVAAGTYYVKGTVAADANYKTATSTAAKFTISPASIASAAVTLKSPSVAYTGKNQTSAVKSVKVGSTTLTSSDYTVTNVTKKNAGSYTVTVKGKGNYSGTKTAAFKITQASNKATAAKTSVTKSLTANKKTKKLAKATTVALPKVTTKFGTATWKVTAKDKKGFLSLSGNRVKVKAGAKKGTTYTIKLQANVAKTSNYKAASSKAVTVKVKVK